LEVRKLFSEFLCGKNEELQRLTVKGKDIQSKEEIKEVAKI